MMEVKVDGYHPHKIVKTLASRLNIDSETDCLEEFLILPEAFGKGRLSSFIFSDGIGMLVLDGILNEDLHIHLNSDSAPPLQFNFAIQGGIFHDFNDGQMTYRLDDMQSSMTASTSHHPDIFRFPANTDLVFVIIFMLREKYLEKVDCYIEDMPERIQEIVQDKEGKKIFFYKGNYSAQVMDDIHMIRDDINSDIIRATFLEGKSLELISAAIKQFKDDARPSSEQRLLRRFDIEQIRDAKKILKENLQNPPTISDLAKTVGINQTKLKKGFKYLYDSTIKNYVINERLELAKLLILQDEMDLKEIAAKIGYSNHSHFSRVFKRKFGVLPRDYVKSTRKRISTLIDNDAENRQNKLKIV